MPHCHFPPCSGHQDVELYGLNQRMAWTSGFQWVKNHWQTPAADWRVGRGELDLPSAVPQTATRQQSLSSRPVPLQLLSLGSGNFSFPYLFIPRGATTAYRCPPSVITPCLPSCCPLSCPHQKS